MMIENAVKNAQVEDLEFFKNFCDKDESKDYKNYCNAFKFNYLPKEQYKQELLKVYEEINKKYDTTPFVLDVYSGE